MRKRTFLTSVAVLATNLLLNNSGLALPNDSSIEQAKNSNTSISNPVNPFVLTNADNNLLLARGHSSHRSHSSHSSHYSGSSGYGSGGYSTPTYTPPSSYQAPTTITPSHPTTPTYTPPSYHPTQTYTATPNTSIPATQTDSIPQFNDYLVDQIYTGKNHPLVLSEFGKTYRTRLSHVLNDGKPDFAGHYIVVKWGCGSSGCNTGAVVDVITGEAYPFPVSISSVYPLKPEFSNDDGQELIYKLKSRIMVFAGNLEGTTHGSGEDTVEFYEFKDGVFTFLKSVPYGKKSISN